MVEHDIVFLVSVQIFDWIYSPLSPREALVETTRMFNVYLLCYMCMADMRLLVMV
jgi:hypothetical protein